MIWKVFRYDINSNAICKYNIFSHSGFASDVCELLNQDIIKEDFEKILRRSLMYYFWSKCEYETVITSWPVYISKTELSRLNAEVKEHDKKWGYQPYRINVEPDAGEKIDVYQQVMLNWDTFVDYVWSKRNYQG